MSAECQKVARQATIEINLEPVLVNGLDFAATMRLLLQLGCEAWPSQRLKIIDSLELAIHDFLQLVKLAMWLDEEDLSIVSRKDLALGQLVIVYLASLVVNLEFRCPSTFY